MMAPRPLARDWRRVAPLALVLGLGVLLRLGGLGSVGLWYDECITAYRATLAFGELLADLRPSGQAPLFYLLEKLIHQTLGHQEWKLRLLPALCGIASVALGYHLGRRWIGRQAGLASALLLATSPLHLHYSREARAYSLLMLLVLLSLWCIDRVVTRPGSGAVALAGLALSAVAYTHGIGVVYLAPVVATAMLHGLFQRRWPVLLGLTVAGLMALAVFLPWLPDYAQQVGSIDEPYHWAEWHWEEVFPWQVPRSLAALSHGSQPPVTNMVTSTSWPAWLAAGVSALLVVAGWHRRATWQRPRMAPLLVAGGVVSLVLLFVGAWLRAPVYVIGRADSPALPFLLLLAGAGVQTLPRRSGWILLAVLVALSIRPVVAELRNPDKDLDRRMTGLMAVVMEDGDVLLTSGPVYHTAAYHLERWGREVDLRSWPETATPDDRVGLTAEALLIAARARELARPVWWLVWSEYHLRRLSPALFDHFEVVGQRYMYKEVQFLRLRSRLSRGHQDKDE